MAGGGFPYEALRDEMRALGVAVPLPPSPDASRIDAMRDLWTAAGLEAVETRGDRRPADVRRLRRLLDDDPRGTERRSEARSDGIRGSRACSRRGCARACRLMPTGRITYRARANAVKGAQRTPMMDPIRRKILKTGAAATVMAAAPRVLAQQTGQGGAAMSFYEKGPVRIHYEEAGSGFPLLLIAGGGLNSTIAALSQSLQPDRRVQGRVPLHRVGPAQRQQRPVLRPARDRPAVGCLYRRPSRPDGSPGHRQVHGDGLLHRRPLHLEPPAAGAQSRRRRRAGAAERVASGDARLSSTTPT